MNTTSSKTMYFDNFKRAKSYAKENDAKVERTTDSTMKYKVVITTVKSS